MERASFFVIFEHFLIVKSSAINPAYIMIRLKQKKDVAMFISV